MDIFLIVTGVVLFIYGLSMVVGFIKTRIFKDSDIEKESYLRDKYLSGLKIIAAGVLLITCGMILYYQIGDIKQILKGIEFLIIPGLFINVIYLSFKERAIK